MHRIGLATSSDYPELAAPERALIPAFASLNAKAEPVVWSDRSVEWSAYSAIVVRSCWDYHRRHDEFVGWTNMLESRCIRTFNPPALLRWNSDKRYLNDLAIAGARVVPTEWTNPSDSRTLRVILEARGWADAVVKPAISASAHETRRVSIDSASSDEAWFAAVRGRGWLLVQPLLEEVARDGEWSLVYIDGRFSHAALKRPRLGDFRVQAEHGGSSTLIEHVEPSLVRAAEDMLSLVREPWVYARVDGCVVDGAFTLMELEMVEPSLFFELAPVAAGRLASAVVERLRDA